MLLKSNILKAINEGIEKALMQFNDNNEILFGKNLQSLEKAINPGRSILAYEIIFPMILNIHKGINLCFKDKLAILDIPQNIIINEICGLILVFEKIKELKYKPCWLIHNGYGKELPYISFIYNKLDKKEVFLDSIKLLDYVFLKNNIIFINESYNILLENDFEVNYRISDFKLDDGVYDYAIISKLLNKPNFNIYNKFININRQRTIYAAPNYIEIKNLEVPNYIIAPSSFSYVFNNVKCNILYLKELFRGPIMNDFKCNKIEIEAVLSNIPDMFYWIFDECNVMLFDDLLNNIKNPNNYNLIKNRLEKIGNPNITLSVKPNLINDEDIEGESTFFELSDLKDHYEFIINEHRYALDCELED